MGIVSISSAYPIFRSSSSAESYALAQRLCDLMSWQGRIVRMGAELRTVEDVLRMVDVLPNALYVAEGVPRDPEQSTDGYRADALPTDRGEFEALLPFILDVVMPVGELEESFVRALGAGPATIDWEGHWPDVPELGLWAAPKYEGVQAVFNSDDVGWERPSQDHTVFVHLRRDLPRAEWLAGQVGGRVLGEPQIG